METGCLKSDSPVKAILIVERSVSMEILIDILGNAAYDIIKNKIVQVFGKSDNNRNTKLIHAINKAAKRFFDRYGDLFGTPSSSFLAHEENWTLILESIYYGKEKLNVDAFKIQGLGIDEVCHKLAIRDFINLLEEEMHDDWELDKILTEKEHINETKKLIGQVTGIEKVIKDLKNLIKSPDDIEVKAIFDRLKDEFNESICPGLIGGTLIHRSETDQCLSAIDENRLIILYGAAGYGKSGVLYELGKKLDEKGIVWLPLRLDRRPPEKNAKQYGIDMGLPCSPVISLARFAGEKPSVLFLDQLDAIRWTSRHSANALDVCKELIREILVLRYGGKNISVVISCRTFDLEHDPEIKGWLGNIKVRDFVKIHVGKLSEPEVRRIIGDAFDRMTVRQKEILLNPQNLSMWYELNKYNKMPLFRSATELMRRFWEYRRFQLENAGVTSEGINKVLGSLVEWLEENGKISAPDRVISHCSITAVNAFKSFGIIQEQNNRISFCHQSYLDFLIAERLLNDIDNGESIITWLGVKEKQTLFRREQLRQALTMLFEESPNRFLEAIKQILLSDNIRFHLKHLVLELLGHMKEDSLIADFLMSLLEDKYWKPHLLETVFYGNVFFVKCLIRKGIISNWLNSEDPQIINQGLWLLRSISEKAPDEVVELLEPFVDQGSDWQNRIRETICLDISNDSDRMFELRLRLVKRGIMPVFIDWKSLGRKYPLRALKLIETILSTIDLKQMEDNDDWDYKSSKWEEFNPEELTSLYSAAQMHPEETWEYLMPHVERLTCFQNAESNWEIERWQRNWLDKGSYKIVRVVVDLLIKAGEKLAEEKPQRLLKMAEKVQNSKSRVTQSILIEVYAKLPTEFSDVAIKWLLDNPKRLALGDRHIEEEWLPAKRLIETHSPLCSEELFRELENKILYYHEPDEREWAKYCLERRKKGYIYHYWGMAQYFLLPALAKERVNKKTLDLIRVLNRKFVGYFDRSIVSGGWIGSPLDKNLDRISDKAWLGIINNKTIPCHDGRFEQVSSNYAVESSIFQFSRSLHQIAKRYPERFGRLALAFPEDVHPYYVEAILDAVAQNKPDANEYKDNWKPASVNTVYAVVDRFMNFEDRETARSYCWLIGNRSSEFWPDKALDRLIDLAISHPDPISGKLNLYTPGKTIENESVDSLFQNTINCVRGVAAKAIGELLWNQPELFNKLRPAIESLVKDHHPVVRMAAIYTLVPIINIDREQAVKWFVEASSLDLRIPASYFAIKFFQYTIRDYYKNLSPIIKSMIGSENEEVLKQGSQLVTAFFIFYGFFGEEYSLCLNGKPLQRAGVAKVAADLIGNKKYSQKCREILSQLINDTDRDVMKEVSSMFRHKDFDLAENIPLAIQFAYSKAFSENPYSLFSCLEEFKDSLLSFSEVILEICNAISSTFLEETRTFQSRLGFVVHKISPLLLRLYEQAQDTDMEIANKCLDAWDVLFERRVGMTRELTKAIEK